MARLSAQRTGPLYPQEIFLVLFLLEAESTPEPWRGRKMEVYCQYIACQFLLQQLICFNAVFRCYLSLSLFYVFHMLFGHFYYVSVLSVWLDLETLCQQLKLRIELLSFSSSSSSSTLLTTTSSACGRKLYIYIYIYKTSACGRKLYIYIYIVKLWLFSSHYICLSNV